MESVVLLLGPPGSGKGTQSERLTKVLDAAHISSGALLRRDPAVYAQSAGGALASSGDVLRLLEGALVEISKDQPIVLDGVARLPEEITWLDNKLKEIGRPMTNVVRLVVPEQELVKRLNHRLELEGRIDDDLAGITKRLDVYNNVTKPNQDYWKKSPGIQEIDGVGTPDEISKRIQEALSAA